MLRMPIAPASGINTTLRVERGELGRDMAAMTPWSLTIDYEVGVSLLQAFSPVTSVLSKVPRLRTPDSRRRAFRCNRSALHSFIPVRALSPSTVAGASVRSCG